MGEIDKIIKKHQDGAVLNLFVTAGSRKIVFPAGVNNWRKCIDISVTAAAKDNKANKEVIKTIRKLVFDDNGHVDKSNPHMDIIFEEAYNLGYKDGLKQGKRPRIKGVKNELR
jgi:uncharacterized protein (TIGR00251 family)